MKVSIIIPVYNAQDTIQKAIDSVLDQDFPRRPSTRAELGAGPVPHRPAKSGTGAGDFEIIVVNDGSTDRTPEILKTYKEQIKIINQKNQGAVKAANRGLREAKGKYLIKLDSDDYFEPTILKEMATILDKNLEIDFVYCDYYEKSEKGKTKLFSTKNIFNILSEGVMYRKQKFKKEGFYREDLKLPEYDLLLKTQRKWRGYHIPQPLYYFNRSKKSLSGKKKWVEEAMSELKKLHPLKEVQKIRKF